jgi:hypothetical protein
MKKLILIFILLASSYLTFSQNIYGRWGVNVQIQMAWDDLTPAPFINAKLVLWKFDSTVNRYVAIDSSLNLNGWFAGQEPRYSPDGVIILILPPGVYDLTADIMGTSCYWAQTALDRSELIYRNPRRGTGKGFTNNGIGVCSRTIQVWTHSNGYPQERSIALQKLNVID